MHKGNIQIISGFSKPRHFAIVSCNSRAACCYCNTLVALIRSTPLDLRGAISSCIGLVLRLLHESRVNPLFYINVLRSVCKFIVSWDHSVCNWLCTCRWLFILLTSNELCP